MAPSDFYLFPKLKSHLRDAQYGSNESVIETVNEYLGDQENALRFEGIKSSNRYKLSALPDYIEKKWLNFQSLVSQSTRG